MKKLLTLIAFICFWANANAQYVNIPDATFRSFLMNKYPNCFDTLWRMDTTCSDILNEKKLYYDVHVGTGSTGGSGHSTISIKGIKYFKNLDSLIYLHNLLPFPALDALTDLPQNLKYLSVDLPEIDTVGALPNSLNEFDFIVRYASFTKSFTLPQNLKVLKCSSVMSSCFSYFPNSIEHIEFTNSLSTSLPALPSNLKYLDCSSNILDSLPNLPTNLTYLNCSNNKLHKLPNLSDSLETLNCYSNSYFFLPYILPKNLKSLDFSYTNATGFPLLPSKLERLICAYNWIDLPPDNFPNSLKTFYCSHNGITFFPDFPLTLSDFHFDNNRVYSLPKLPNSLGIIFGYNNPINCLPVLPANLQAIDMNFSINIACVPNNIVNCNFLENGKLISHPPVCNPTNNKNHCISIKIQSFAFTDNNNNNKQDNNEYPKHNLKLTLSNNNYSYTNNNGTAYINADSLGIYTITAQAPPLYNAVPASYTHTFNSYDTLVMDTFALQPTIIKDSLSISITPLNWAARPGFKYVYKCEFENVGTTIVNPNISFKYDSSILIFDSTNNAAITNTGNSLSLAINNFVPGQTNSFYVYCTVKTTATLGNSLQATASINANNANVTDTANTTIRGSYDPNDKQATPQLSVAQVTDNLHYINYTVRFQNTGNDTAFTVVVADTLDENKLQTNTLQLTGLSHNCKVSQNDNIVYFEFLNINLPDSNKNKTTSNGFVSFRVKPLTTLVDGNIVPNKASIYFDYNSPINTNTANTIIGNTLPLTLTAFGAIPKEEQNKIFVYWNTANEINTSYFIIEQSNDARTFAPAAEVAAIGKGNNSYYYNIAKNNVEYVRLKMVDKNGTYSYSNIIRITRNDKQQTINVQSPAKNELKINVTATSLHNTKASLINGQGKIVKTFILKQGYQTIDIVALQSGLYYLQTNEVVKKVVVE